MSVLSVLFSHQAHRQELDDGDLLDREVRTFALWIVMLEAIGAVRQFGKRESH